MNTDRILDLSAILIATRDAPRDQALKFRDALRQMLRSVEDMHGFPHSFETKDERQRRIDSGGYARRDD